MSVKRSAAARRPAMSVLLHRILGSVFGWLRAWRETRAAKSSRAPLSVPSPLVFESLESRLLMSADLVGEIPAAALPNEVLPSEKINVGVIVRNIGNTSADLIPVVRLYASTTGQIDSRSVLLGESAVKFGQINAGKSTTVNVSADASRLDDPGSYSLFAVVDATNRVRETKENNNVAVSAKPLNITWSFGNVPGHSNTSSITIEDDCGAKVTFSLSGPGRGDVVLGENGFDLKLTGTNTSSVLKITTSGGRGYSVLHDVNVAGSLKEINAGDVDLSGQLSIAGTIRSIELGDIENGARISIVGSGVAVRLTAESVTGATIQSASAFESITIEQWVSGSAGAGRLSAPSIAKLTVEGAFAAGIELTGAASGQTLGTVKIDGRVTGGTWNVGGTVGTISVKSIESGWTGNFQAAVQKITTSGNFAGTLATPSIASLEVGGNLVGAKLLIGASLGSDGTLDRFVGPQDSFGPGFLGVLKVGGSVTNSSIQVGVDPVDGIYGNGNDVLIGGTSSRIQSITVDGRLIGTTVFVAGAFPTTVRINGQTLRSTSVPQFKVGATDSTPPLIAASLLADTGSSATDGVTNNPAITGSVVESGTVTVFRAALDSNAPASFVDIRSRLQPNGSFSLDQAALEQIARGPLTDGAHTLFLQATDGAGNSSASNLAFTLDRGAPVVVHFDLDAASDSGTVGDTITNRSSVTLRGQTEALSRVELGGTGLVTIADAAGQFSFDSIHLFEGFNAYDLIVSDKAGNSTTANAAFILDTQGPSASLQLIHDTGPSASDRWTRDPSVLVSTSDNFLVASLAVSVDGGAPFELIGGPLGGIAIQLDAPLLDHLAGGRLQDGPHQFTVTARDVAGNLSVSTLDLILDRTAPTTPQFFLAPESDSGVPGDQHTNAAFVSLLGMADAGIDLFLNGVQVTPVWDQFQFRIDGVPLAVGDNVLNLEAVDPAGNRSAFSQVIVREGGGIPTEFPDLVVTSIDSEFVEMFGQQFVQVDWITANVGNATAHGTAGAWIETLRVSYDDIPFNEDDWFLDTFTMFGDLAAGAEQARSILIPKYDFIDWTNPGLRFIVSLDTDQGSFFVGNQVIEKAAGEYNNTTLQDISTGQVPPAVPEWGEPEVPVDGTAIGGSLEAGTSRIYTFSVDGGMRLLFDSLSARNDVNVTIREAGAGGATKFFSSFANADAFGLGGANGLMQLAAGNYEVEIDGAAGDFAFRLLDVDAVAAPIPFDGGPLLGQLLVRGDQSQVYQFEGAVGFPFIVGGPADSTVEGALFWRLFDPAGQQIWTSSVEPTDILTFQQSGTYTLVVEGRAGKADPTRYNAYAFSPQDRAYGLEVGIPVRGFLDAPGLTTTYSFTLNEATALFFDGSLDVNGDRIRWTLSGPGGVEWTGSTRNDSGASGVDLPILQVPAGIYTLRITGDEGASGWYSFRLMDVAHEPAPTMAQGEAAHGFIAPGYLTNLHRFHGEAGQSVSILLDVIGILPDFDPPRWILVDPQGNARMGGTAETGFPAQLDASGDWTLVVQGRQSIWAYVEYQLHVSASESQGFDLRLAAGSDTGEQGDGRTTREFVDLEGFAAPFSQVALQGTLLTAVADAQGHFTLANIRLGLGDNAFVVRSLDGTGATFYANVVREAETPESGFPDLVVRNINTEDLGVDELGRTTLRVTWTTTNEGSATAVGRRGGWAESVHLSYDDLPWNQNDTQLDWLLVTSTLAPGASEVHSLDVKVEPWFAPGYRIYVVTDGEQARFNPDTGMVDVYANEVAEKTAGEYNNLAIQDLPSGIPPALPPESDVDIALNGTAVGGSLGAAESHVYSFTLGETSHLYFDALTSTQGTTWSIRPAGGGDAIIGRAFASSDAFGAGTSNPLFELDAGIYELVITNPTGPATYGFRLVDPDLAAFQNTLYLDGGPLLQRTLVRGDWTDLYQFQANEGDHYVAGGPNDWATDGALHWRLFDPEGNQIWTGTRSPSDEREFELTGTYTLMVEGRYERTDSAHYSAYVFTPQDRVLDLEFNQRIQSNIDAPGQVNTYQFHLDHDTVAFFDGYLESNGPHFTWTLSGPGGIVESGNTRNDTTAMDGSARLLSLIGGNYTLAIQGLDDASGWVTFAFFDLLNGPAQSLEVGEFAIGSLTPGFNSTAYRFEAEAGEALTIRLGTVEPGWINYDPTHWLLVDGNGQLVAAGAAGTPVDVTAAAAGNYTLLIQAHQMNWYPVNYSLSVTAAGEAPGVTFGLAPESDTGEPGDLQTDLNFVNLAGTATPFAQVFLEFNGQSKVADENGAFQFDDVLLFEGFNSFIVRAVDAEGHESVASERIYLTPLPPDFFWPDLVASNITRQVYEVGAGNFVTEVSWTTTNVGVLQAIPGPGFWTERLYFSADDDPNGADDIFIGEIQAGGILGQGGQNLYAVISPLTALSGHYYVVVDVFNDVVESFAGEGNNLTMEA